ncbi:hypothetical protein Pelo_14443 [Pelomyxa schiedti]|nr:hypothetical protein Pelo_14443 [Pelomyxa schiedti]
MRPIRLLVLGDSGVGKTCLLTRYTSGGMSNGKKLNEVWIFDISSKIFVPASTTANTKGATLKSVFRSSPVFYIYKSGMDLTGDWFFVT